MSNLPSEYMQACHLPIASSGRPYRCPVCGGRGTVPVDFYAGSGYSTSTNPVKCRACDGRGIVIA